MPASSSVFQLTHATRSGRAQDQTPDRGACSRAFGQGRRSGGNAQAPRSRARDSHWPHPRGARSRPSNFSTHFCTQPSGSDRPSNLRRLHRPPKLSFSPLPATRCSSRPAPSSTTRRPFGRGGDNTVDNIRLVCRTHNTYLAERDYGKEWMERYRRSPDRVSGPSVVYALARRDVRTCPGWYDILLGGQPSLRPRGPGPGVLR
jgi:hypothetical protein